LKRLVATGIIFALFIAGSTLIALLIDDGELSAQGLVENCRLFASFDAPVITLGNGQTNCCGDEIVYYDDIFSLDVDFNEREFDFKYRITLVEADLGNFIDPHDTAIWDEEFNIQCIDDGRDEISKLVTLELCEDARRTYSCGEKDHDTYEFTIVIRTVDPDILSGNTHE